MTNNLTNDIPRVTNEGEPTTATFRDFSKAFDTANYYIMVKMPEREGIIGRALGVTTVREVGKQMEMTKHQKVYM